MMRSQVISTKEMQFVDHSTNVMLAAMSVWLLIAVVLFVGPLLAVVFGADATRWMGAGALLAMAASYLPMLRFYRLPVIWAFALPVTGAFYLAMTWRSALDWTRGVQSNWRGRKYAAEFADGPSR